MNQLLSFPPQTDPVNVNIGGQDLTRTSFAPTEVMSTYLLAFVVSDFGHIKSNPDAEVLVNIYFILPSEMEMHVKYLYL